MPRKPAARAYTKGTRTRQRIVEHAAVLFNTRGVAGASINDVSLATGLEKGGIYNHFETKEALALAAFDYAAGLVFAAIESAVAGEARPLEKLGAMIDVYRHIAGKPFITGGCPILNAAVDADDTNPPLRSRVRRAMDRWRGLVADLLRAAVASGELPPLDVDGLADGTIATLEGGVMLGKLYGNPVHLQRAADHVANHLRVLASGRAAAV
jgi:TetR/AcrR family transcriptional repressor of nem operon